MALKQQSNESTFIFPGDSSFNSGVISRINPPKQHSLTKRLSYSLEIIKNPYIQTLPLKFPKNRIRAAGPSHMLKQTEVQPFRPSIRTSQLRNKQIEQKPRIKQKGKGIYFKNNEQSADNNINQKRSHNSSLEKLQTSSLQKVSKRLFHDVIIKQSLKDPILIGQSHKTGTHKKFSSQKQYMKNHGEGFKECINWKVEKLKEKQKFENMCNAKSSKINIQCLNLNLDLSALKKKNPGSKARQQPKTSRQYERPKTYRQLYIARKA